MPSQAPLSPTYWADLFPHRRPDELMRVEPLRADCIFLRTRVSAPMPSGQTIVEWQWFETMRDHLRTAFA
jgi:hypothetical protein